MCKYCSVGLPYKSNIPIWYISLDMVKYINYMIKKYLSNYNIYLHILGGEPFLHNQLAQIIHIFENNKFIKKIIIMTNNSIDVDCIFKNKINIPIYFSFSFHSDVIAQKYNFNKQLDVFISNIKKLENIITYFQYKIEILYNMTYPQTYFNNLKKIFTQYFEDNKIILNPIHSTLWYNSNTDNDYYLNPVFNKSVSINSFFTITNNNDIGQYCIVNDCAMVQTMTSLYDISFWKNINRIYSKKTICTKKICLCRLCLALNNILE